MTARPRRIQRQRVKGWRMPEGAKYVGRPTIYGNPWAEPERNGAPTLPAVVLWRGEEPTPR